MKRKILTDRFKWSFRGSLGIIFLLFQLTFPREKSAAQTVLEYPAATPKIDAKTQTYLGSIPSDSTVAVWVFFTDKGIKSIDEYKTAVSLSVNQISERSMKRRALRGVKTSLDFSDLPVKGEYIEKLENYRFKIRNISRWLNAVSVMGNREQIEKVKDLPFVRAIQKVARFTRSRPSFEEKQYQGLGKLQEGQVFGYGESYAQLAQIHVPELHNVGYSGKGVLITILDTGYWLSHPAFDPILNSGRLVATRDFIHGDSNVEDENDKQRDHGTSVWSAVGGFVNDTLIGSAYGAEFALAKTEQVDSEVVSEEDNWVSGAEWADSIGADVLSSSLGYNDWYTYQDMDGKTALCTIAADIAVSKGIVVVNAAGNERDNPNWIYIIAPADGFGVIAVGAVDLSGNIASFSSMGPTYDGRIKPDVDACGVGTYCASSYGGYTHSGGTSLATPLVAGICALLLEVNPSWNPTIVREALWSTASRAENPDNSMGYGIANASKASGLDLVISPQRLTFEAMLGDTQTMQKTLSISNFQGGGLEWEASTPAGWITLFPNSGDTSDMMWVTVHPAGLKAGTNTDSILFTYIGAIDSSQKVPVNLVLHPSAQVRAFPNPFRDSITVIVENSDATSQVRIHVFTVAGELVYKFPDKSDFISGDNGKAIYENTWDGRNENGEEVGSGIYLLKIDMNNKSRIVKVAKVK
ncbi:MAG: S8 family peptidase [Candidatus Zixiibacteriota bacterium]